MLNRDPLLLLLTGAFLWAIITVLSATGVNVFGISWNFRNTSELGGSFGVFSAFAAGLAAYYTFVALVESRSQRVELENRQLERDTAERLSRADENFYRLLDLRRSLLADLSIDLGDKKISGTDVIEYIVQRVRDKISIRQDNEVEKKYHDGIGEYLDDSGHYLRFSYHIVKYVVENFPQELQYDRVRVLRSLLSNSEQILIALNCMYGEGRGQFAQWVEEFAVLHNLSERDKKALQIDQAFESGAFIRVGPGPRV